MSDWRDVHTAVLGRWPATVGNWPDRLLVAFVAELGVHLTADEALYAIRAWRGKDQILPPSVSQLEEVARRDPERPTADEMLDQIFGPGGVLSASPRPALYDSPWQMMGARDDAARAAAAERSPYLAAFVEHYGVHRLRMVEVNGERGHLAYNDVKRSIEQFLENREERDVAALAAGGRRGELGRFDPRALSWVRRLAPVGERDDKAAA